MPTAASTWSATVWKAVVHMSSRSAPPASTPRAAPARTRGDVAPADRRAAARSARRSRRWRAPGVPSAARRAAPLPPGSAACSTRGCSPSSSRRPVRCSTRRRVCHSRGGRLSVRRVDQRHDPLPDHPAVPARELASLTPRPGHVRDLEPHPRGRRTGCGPAASSRRRRWSPRGRRGRGAVLGAHRQNGTELPGALVRRAGDPASGDATVDEAYAGVEATLAMFEEVCGRSSYDGRGAPVRGDGALREELRQRVLGRHPAGVRRRGRAGVRPVHQAGRRAAGTSSPTPSPAHRQPRLRGPVGRPQRVDVGRVRVLPQAAGAAGRARARPTG